MLASPPVIRDKKPDARISARPGLYGGNQ